MTTAAAARFRASNATVTRPDGVVTYRAAVHIEDGKMHWWRGQETFPTLDVAAFTAKGRGEVIVTAADGEYFVKRPGCGCRG